VSTEAEPTYDDPRVTATDRLRVLTWNVWWRAGVDWRARQPAIAATLAAADADVVALQEVWGTAEGTQVDQLAGALGMHGAYAAPSLPPPSPGHPGVEVGIGLLSRWPISGRRVVPLPSRHRRPPPVALCVSLAHPAGPLHVVVSCLEWERAFDDDRHAQARALLGLDGDRALDGPLPVVLAGDLNATPDSTVLAPLLGELTDAWTAGGGDPAAATVPSSHPDAAREAGIQRGHRVDHVLVRPGRPGGRVVVPRIAMVDAEVDGVHASDHKAVICDVSTAES
jgi:endonuclease/exonuclease/phosphatase family metal-dependent hydrolase